MRGEEGKKTPKKRDGEYLIFITSHSDFLSDFLRVQNK